MSESYRRLCQDLPPAEGGPARFAADPKKVKAWVAALPRANPQAVEQEIARALPGLLGQRLEMRPGRFRIDVIRCHRRHTAPIVKTRRDQRRK